MTDPDWHPGGVGTLYAAAFEKLAKGNFHIVASSQNTADQLRVNWGIAPSRISILHLGLFALATPQVVAGKYPDAPFLLFVGSLEDRKNLQGLLHAYSESNLFAHHGIRLRLIGSPNGESHPISLMARSIPGVDVGGFADEGEIAASYRDCLAFVYPSLCEGFGLPLLEAMHHGCLCLSTICGASPEVAGDAALYVNPYDPQDMVNALHRVVSLDEPQRHQFQQRARKRADLFTWTRFYDGLAEILQKAA